MLLAQALTPDLMTLAPAVISGCLVGLSMGLTGGGGAILAVPLLVYWLGVPPQAAVAISLATVAGTAVIGTIERARLGQVEFPTGLLFAAAGMLTAPLGSWLGKGLPPQALLLVPVHVGHRPGRPPPHFLVILRNPRPGQGVDQRGLAYVLASQQAAQNQGVALAGVVAGDQLRRSAVRQQPGQFPVQLLEPVRLGRCLRRLMLQGSGHQFTPSLPRSRSVLSARYRASPWLSVLLRPSSRIRRRMVSRAAPMSAR